MSAPEPRSRIFHLSAPGRAPRFDLSPEWTPEPFAREGFIHLSSGPQLAGTLERHFATEEVVRLIEVVVDDGDDALVWERSRGGMDFPHLYRPFAPKDLARGWTLHRKGDSWTLPRLGEAPTEDDPPGEDFSAAPGDGPTL